MQTLEVPSSRVTATTTKSSMFACTHRKSMRPSVRKVCGLGLQTVQVWNVYTDFYNLNMKTVWAGGVGGGLNCYNKKATLMTCGWGCNIIPSLSWSACPKAVIPHGFTVGAQGDKLTYACDEGYKLFNKGWWGEATCENHLWSGLEKCIGKSASTITICKSAWKMQV